jgi:hypothetical protein
MNRRCLTLADVVGERSFFIIADSCVAGAQVSGTRWVCSGLATRSYEGTLGTTNQVNWLESGKGHEKFWSILAELACSHPLFLTQVCVKIEPYANP